MSSAVDVAEFASWMEKFGQRATEKISVLRAERAAVPRDGSSLKAYDGMVEMMESARAMAGRHMDDFLEAFREAQVEHDYRPAM